MRAKEGGDIAIYLFGIIVVNTFVQLAVEDGLEKSGGNSNTTDLTYIDNEMLQHAS